MLNYNKISTLMLLAIFIFSILIVLHVTSETTVAQYQLAEDFRMQTQQCASGDGTYEVCRWDPQMICEITFQTVCGGGSSNPEVN